MEKNFYQEVIHSMGYNQSNSSRSRPRRRSSSNNGRQNRLVLRQELLTNNHSV
jgi:hypothetical protein